MTFTTENTTGYTPTQLDALNAEWERTAEDEGLEPDTDEYHQREKAFQDEVAKRHLVCDACGDEIDNCECEAIGHDIEMDEAGVE